MDKYIYPPEHHPYKQKSLSFIFSTRLANSNPLIYFILNTNADYGGSSSSVCLDIYLARREPGSFTVKTSPQHGAATPSPNFFICFLVGPLLSLFRRTAFVSKITFPPAVYMDYTKIIM